VGVEVEEVRESFVTRKDQGGGVKPIKYDRPSVQTVGRGRISS